MTTQKCDKDSRTSHEQDIDGAITGKGDLKERHLEEGNPIEGGVKEGDPNESHATLG